MFFSTIKNIIKCVNYNRALSIRFQLIAFYFTLFPSQHVRLLVKGNLNETKKKKEKQIIELL